MANVCVVGKKRLVVGLLVVAAVGGGVLSVIITELMRSLLGG